jgi:hypothetical protein
MRRLLAVIAAAVLFSAGCGSDPEPAHDAAPTSGSASSTPPDVPTENWNDPQPADAADTSYPACDVPATFDVAAGWAAKAVPADVAKALGPHTLACEIDGKPAGVIGFIRVYRAAGSDARAALTAQAADKAPGMKYRQVNSPAGVGWEGSFGPADKPERAFAVTVRAATVVIHWSGLDADEHKAGLPAYLLAQASVTRRG